MIYAIIHQLHSYQLFQIRVENVLEVKIKHVRGTEA